MSCLFASTSGSGLLAELAMVEEEILWLERKVDELKLNLYQGETNSEMETTKEAAEETEAPESFTTMQTGKFIGA
ncbi:hypothetical protein GH714_035986 [Hevea brasiliensis]|uniref:Ternary complex factor MIP1 leucine-zipper domain-containing protein n=1 Tax=Hevea brasiliensis TaxID=3981 RepID=A0A6A6L3W7_HEVBR|nr:hypothetical protein GH714_035986 [Hevea brasiliensis]